MKIASSATTYNEPEMIIKTYTRLVEQLETQPDLLFFACTENFDLTPLFHHVIRQKPELQITGCTSCLNVMSDGGIHSGPKGSLAMLAISDPTGSYGVGGATTDSVVSGAASDALNKALHNADCPGEVPPHIWMHSSPGNEEILMAEIESVTGENVPISGGSSGDDTLTGNWRVFANGSTMNNGIAITALFPSTDIFFAFHSGYEPTKLSGHATKVEPLDSTVAASQTHLPTRLLKEIDNRPAAEVYNEWTKGAIEPQLHQGGVILSESSLHPLGLIAGYISDIPFYQLSHPETVTDDGAMTLFSSVSQGEVITLMQGSPDSLVSRAGRVISSLLKTHSLDSDDIAGAMIIYCAGCMLAVQDRLDEVVNNIKEVLPATPFLGSFTFGEQGSFLCGTNRHGNLMISVLLFTKTPKG